MKRAGLLAAMLVAVAGGYTAATLPPERLTPAPFSDGTIPGVLHIHTNRSDGRSSPDDVAAAAARAGLRFIVFTDHGDGTRRPDPPVYRSGVLCLDGVEISTTGGHYIALDMGAAPYPLAGEPRDVVEDVRRLGGFGIAAHPDSPKPGLRWSNWDAPMDGVEWINPDTSWRVLAAGGWRSRFRLFAGLLHYPFRPEETLASLLTDLQETLPRWSAMAARRPVVGLAGADAHANLALRNTDPVETRFAIPLPGYDASFRMLSVHVAPGLPLSGDAAADAAAVMRAIRAGHLYVAIDGLASPPALEFTAATARGAAGQGDEIEAGGPVSLRVRSNAPPGFTTIIWRDGEMLATGDSGGSGGSGRTELTADGGEAPAVYRAEVRAGGQTWLLSNAIYVRAPGQAAPAAAAETMASSLAMFDGKTEAGWHLESDPSSKAAMDIAQTLEGPELRVRFALAHGAGGSQWAALVWGTPIGHAPVNVADYDRLTFTARAERPMRLSIQFRTSGAEGVQRRWQRSVYVDSVPAPRTVRFSELVPSLGTDTPRPTLDEISQILFVIDTVNTEPGTTGRFWISDPRFAKP